jgi:hypothetical protein
LKWSAFGFELNRGFIAEGGMEPATVIDVFEEDADASPSLFERGVGFAVDLLVAGNVKLLVPPRHSRGVSRLR